MSEIRQCECGAEFTRPPAFEEWARQEAERKYPGTFYKRKLKCCDGCCKAWTEAALRRLPEVLAVLTEDAAA